MVRDDGPFNFSRINNRAVEAARGAILLFLNNDIEVISPDWLGEMVSHAVRPGVGAVGARLWYPNNTLQHGGVILVCGVAGHAHKGLPAGSGGYCSRAALIQNFSGVTGACLAIRREIFEEVGGFDETLAAAFNDVDFCLRVVGAGYRNVWTPYAELYHHESATRGYEDTPSKRARFQKEAALLQARWGEALQADPYLNPNLSADNAGPVPGFPAPRRRRSVEWRAGRIGRADGAHLMNVRGGAGALRRRLTAFVRRLGPVRGNPTLLMKVFEPGDSLSTVLQTRASIAALFLRGDGIEIGALHQPLSLPTSARVKYVDRMTTTELRRHYEELADSPLVEPDIIDDGERLTTIEENTQDFVIANHFIEHCQNPILTLQNLFRVLRAGGVLYMAVPDKRFTFDVDRPCTTIEHLTRDFAEGPEWSKRQHFEEWSRLVNKRADEAQVQEEMRRLIDTDFSIHFHVWAAAELLELITVLRQFVRFEPELFLRSGPETILVLRKPSE